MPKALARNMRGFSLVELVVVVTILAVLAGAIIPMVTESTEESRIARIAADLKNLKKAANTFFAHTGRYPRNTQEFIIGTNIEGWDGPYIDTFPNNPWGGVSQYQLTPSKWWMVGTSGSAHFWAWKLDQLPTGVYNKLEKALGEDGNADRGQHHDFPNGKRNIWMTVAAPVTNSGAPM